MEFFNYADWIADGRRAAFAKGRPNVETERLSLRTVGKSIFVTYHVELKTTDFEVDVEKMSVDQFSARFFNMLGVEGQV